MFATRLTRLTRALASRSPERAMRRAAAAAPDWSSGTRIGDALKDVQRPPRPSRHGPRRGGRDPLRRLGAGRPRRWSAARWRGWRGSPTASSGSTRASSASAFSVRAGGMVAALPHCDALVSGHSFAALAEVVEAIGARRARRSARAGRPSDEPEPWASATPVAGSSVAMPSGHGPSKGNTTPGWVTDEATERAEPARSASIPAATGRPCRPTRRAGRSPRSATSRSTMR